MKIPSWSRNRHDDYFNPREPLISGMKQSRVVVLLERNGFSVNVPLLNEKCERARIDEANEVRNGMECGIGVKNYTDVKVGDKIEVYETKEVARSL